MARPPKAKNDPFLHEWVNLIRVSGPFPGDELLRKFWPKGLDLMIAPEGAADLGQAHAAWQVKRELYGAFFRFVCDRILGYHQPEHWAEGQDLPPEPRLQRPGLDFRPSAILHQNGSPQLLLGSYPHQQKLDSNLRGYDQSPLELMTELCRSSAVPLALVSNGEHWILIHAYSDAPTTYAHFEVRDWLEERSTLQGFANLLHLRRFFGVDDKQTLAALFQQTLADTSEVTETLGRQVREAVEILVRTFDQLDLDQGRNLLAGLPEARVYEGLLTVMMRLVLVFCAEDRGLFPRETNQLYGNHYALGNLRALLRQKADSAGEEVMERGYDAWCRLLACFRLIHGGLENESLSVPAYGSSLFDPERYPFLEGRQTGQAHGEAQPPRVDNRTVLHLLEALQILRLRKQHTRLLDFQTLGPEEIGYVYEGLLDHTLKRASEPVLGLDGSESGGRDRKPELALSELEHELAKGEESWLKFLADQTGRSEESLKKRLSGEPEGESQLRAACGNDPELLAQMRPFANLIRRDSRGVPFVVLKGGVYVTGGTDRRNSGTHYTPKLLSEETVRHTLDPLVYSGPAEGAAETDWRLKSPEEILALKICDPAMGSGAFLVQTCRYLGARLVEAWSQREAVHGELARQPEAAPAKGAWEEALLGASEEERLAHARRLICTRCLYGVDKNPMAVEMAKLSLWLITLDGKKPFTFLDHHLAHGDSLLGLARMDQLLSFHPDPSKAQSYLFLDDIRKLIQEKQALVLSLRRLVEADVASTIHQIQRQEKLTAEAIEHNAELIQLANLFIGAVLASSGKQAVFRGKLQELAIVLDELHKQGTSPQRRQDLLQKLRQQETQLLGVEPLTGEAREPFHWVLAFPEVFQGKHQGFDALVGNPPFLGGKKITGPFGTEYRDYLLHHLAQGTRGNADLCAYFYLRAHTLVRAGGCFGFIATNTIAQGDTREVGLDRLAEAGCTIYRAIPSRKWPGTANLEVAQTWLRLGPWQGTYTIDKTPTKGITPFLSKPGKIVGTPYQLAANKDKSFIGSYVLGMGFILSEEEAQFLIAKDPKNKQVLFPYLNGEDLNGSPTQSPSRWVINFFDWPLDHATKPPNYEGFVAVDFPDCLKILEERVKPERTRRDSNGKFVLRKPLPQRWWQYADKRPALYMAISKQSKVLVAPRVTKFMILSFVTPEIVTSEAIAVIIGESYAQFGILQASFFEPWVRINGSSMRKDIRFTPSSCFETLPMPNCLGTLEMLGKTYLSHRQQIMENQTMGLTETYNRLHNSRDHAKDVIELRSLHIALDEEVARVYGWSDIDLNHDFYKTTQGERFTISPGATAEMLDRLLTLNHQRYAEEVTKGVHTKTKASPAMQPKSEHSTQQLELF